MLKFDKAIDTGHTAVGPTLSSVNSVVSTCYIDPFSDIYSVYCVSVIIIKYVLIERHLADQVKP